MGKRPKILFLFLLISFYGSPRLQAQIFADAGHEIGVVAGPLAFLSDYGQRYDPSTNVGNTGMGVGLVHYLNFAVNGCCFCKGANSYFTQHFKLRTELDYHWTQLEHFGRWANKDSERGRHLAGMVGETQVLEIGAHLEYHFLNIRDFVYFGHAFDPFISLGANYVSFTPDTYSTLGPLEENLYDRWNMSEVVTDGERRSTWSLVLGAGVRYKLNQRSDLVLNAQWRYYDTDWLDGLNHGLSSNKAKDYIFWLNVGYIYYLNF